MNDLNLIPKSYILKKQKERLKVYMIGAFSLLLVLVLVGFIVPIKMVENLEKERDTLNNQIAIKTDYNAVKSQIDLVEKLYIERDKEAKRIMNIGLKSQEYIDQIENIIPENVFLINFGFENNEESQYIFDFIGVSKNENGVAFFADGLRKMDFFNQVDINVVARDVAIVNQETIEKYNFNIQAIKVQESDLK